MGILEVVDEEDKSATYTLFTGGKSGKLDRIGLDFPHGYLPGVMLPERSEEMLPEDIVRFIAVGISSEAEGVSRWVVIVDVMETSENTEEVVDA